jgi:DNA-directed RNA polymerase subunit RPC12/RpoP
MLSIYTSYKCKTCRKEFVLLSEDINTMANGRYLVCPYCNSKKLSVDKATDSVKECMKESSYKRCNGYIKQRR